MANTPIELFRLGIKTTPRFNEFRPGEIATTIKPDEIEYVIAKQGAGASTLDAPMGLRGNWWWRLAAGTPYDDNVLKLWNDFGNHWSWEPIQDMPLSDYVAVLTEINGKFVPV